MSELTKNMKQIVANADLNVSNLLVELHHLGGAEGKQLADLLQEFRWGRDIAAVQNSYKEGYAEGMSRRADAAQKAELDAAAAEVEEHYKPQMEYLTKLETALEKYVENIGGRRATSVVEREPALRDLLDVFDQPARQAERRTKAQKEQALAQPK
jgi:hypothetical protein